MSRIFFYTVWEQVEPEPTQGGPKVVQQHLQILQAEGYDARVVLDGKRRWFSRLDPHERGIAIKGGTFRQQLSPSDVVVVPAVASPMIDSIPGDRKVLMVQSGGLLFRSLPLEGTDRYPWRHPEVEAVICVSEADRTTIEKCCPTCAVYRVYNQVDPNRFDSPPWDERDDLVLAVTPKPVKNPWHTATVCHMVRSRAMARTGQSPAPADVVPSVRVIEDLEPNEVAELMSRAKMMVFPSVVEGFPLLVLEAAMAGVPVAGYRNQSIGEYMPDRYLHEISDFASMAELIEQFLAADPDDQIHELREQAREAASQYSRSRQRESVLDVWGEILG